MAIRKDLTGKTFGNLTVVGFSEVSRNGHCRYTVECSCGTLKTVLGTHLIQGNTRHCGCLKRKPRNWSGYKDVSGTYYASLLRGANGGKGRKAIPFEVSKEYLGDLLEDQGYSCKYTGLPISVRTKTASVDRIDSSKGYVEGNIQWLHKDVNMMKRHYSEEYFMELCKRVATTAGVCELVDI